MHVIVIGAGVIGVCTAHALRQRGLEVTVIDRRPEAAQESSFGNAGLIAPGYVTPWASPQLRAHLLRLLLSSESPLIFRPSFDRALWRWIRLWLGECDADRYRINRERMQRVARYSQACFAELRDRYLLKYERIEGSLTLLRRPEQVEYARPGLELLAELGIGAELIEPDACRRLEPGLSEATPLAAAIHVPGDEAGNCPLFTRQLKELCERDGVRFRMRDPVLGLRQRGGTVDGVVTAAGEESADAVVMAAGCGSAALLAPLGLTVPIWPVKGYSATTTLTGDRPGPVHALMDETYKTAITPLGSRIRLAGTAEIGATDASIHERARRTLTRVANEWFPGAGRYADAVWWVGWRPMLPDGPPLLGPSGHRGLWLNIGHGSTGWAMAAGCARVVADLLLDHPPEISMDGLTIERWAGASTA